MLIGNQHLTIFFEELRRSNSLAGSYIFWGDPQVGKFTFAKDLARSLESNNGSTFTEALIFQSESPLGIDHIRQIRKFLWQTPVASPYRTIIIDKADRMSHEAQNALLKIIEEPPLNALIILITSYPEILTPTLLSRVKKIYFRRATQKQICQWLEKEFGLKPDLAKNLAKKAMGRPGLAYNLLYDTNTKRVQEMVREFIKGDIFQRHKIIEEVISDNNLLDQFNEFLLRELKANLLPDKSKILKGILKRLVYLKRFNLNKRLQLEIIANQI